MNDSILFACLFHFCCCLFAGIEETVGLIRANGGTCVGYQVDIARKEEVYKGADVIRAEVGDVSILTVNKYLIFPIKIEF